jgi:thiosulfate/3-mercaptopyruvate sulfurtransferase
MIVSVAWLAARLSDPHVVILHVAGPVKSYQQEHIPGARHILFEEFTAAEPVHGQGLSTELPPRARLIHTLESLGVSDDSRIVLYGPAVTITARLYLTLTWLGLGGRTSLLDGGLRAWRSSGRPLASDRPRITRGHLASREAAEVVVSLDWLEANRSRPGTLVLDARDRQFYTGEAGAGMHMPRPGHIPGAVNLPYSELLTGEERWRSRDELATRLRQAGATPGTFIVTYCHVGQQGSLLWLAARWLGYEARLFDGSFEEWSTHDELPVAVGKGTGSGL